MAARSARVRACILQICTGVLVGSSRSSMSSEVRAWEVQEGEEAWASSLVVVMRMGLLLWCFGSRRTFVLPYTRVADRFVRTIAVSKRVLALA